MAGFATVIEDNLKFPFKAKVIGEDVEVVGIDQEDNVCGGIVAICKHLGKKYKIALPALEIKENAEGKEWIDAYKYWLSGEE